MIVEYTFVIIATYSHPTCEGGLYRLTKVVGRDFTVKDAYEWAKSRTGSGVLSSVEINPTDI